MGLFLSDCLVVFVHCPELADVSCRIIRYRVSITSRFPAGLFAERFFAFEFKFSCVIQIVTNHCYNEGSTPLLSGCVGLTWWSLKLSKLASLCLQGRAASVGVAKVLLIFFSFYLFCLSIMSYNIFRHATIV